MTSDEKFLLSNSHLKTAISDPFPELSEWEVCGHLKKKLGFKEPKVSPHAAYKKGFDDAVKIFQAAIAAMPDSPPTEAQKIVTGLYNQIIDRCLEGRKQ